jgi:hypothetical protein
MQSSIVYVVATTVPGAKAAIGAATTLAEQQESAVHVIAARQTRADASFEEQSAPLRALARRIKALPEASSGPVRVLQCVCRRLPDVAQLLAPRAVVVIGDRAHRWWFSRERRLARTLRAAGFRVLYVHADREHPF